MKCRCSATQTDGEVERGEVTGADSASRARSPLSLDDKCVWRLCCEARSLQMFDSAPLPASTLSQLTTAVQLSLARSIAREFTPSLPDDSPAC